MTDGGPAGPSGEDEGWADGPGEDERAVDDSGEVEGTADGSGVDEGRPDAPGRAERPTDDPGRDGEPGDDRGGGGGVPGGRRAEIAADPFCATLGIDLVDLAPGRATTRLTVTDDLLNFHGTPHGGAVYSLADAAFAAASNARGDTALALEANVSYLAAVEVGTTLTADAEETHRSERTAEYAVAVTDEAGDRVATFRGRVYLP